MSHDRDLVCKCVYEHRPTPLELNVHHILPQYLGGPDVALNRIALCPTTHANVHEILRLLLRDGPLTYGEVDAANERPVSRYAYALAVEGYRRWVVATARAVGVA